MIQRRYGPVALACALAAVALAASSPAHAQVAAPSARLSPADSALIERILVAEDRRDSTDVALADGTRHADARVRAIAQRARGRITSATFASRDSGPALPAPTVWPEPAWRLRLRALSPKSDCGALGFALADSAWPVRLRGADLVTEACGADDALVGALRQWVDALSPDASRRAAGGVSWQAAAHAEIALSRARPADARVRLGRLVAHRQWQVRMYAARAAGVLADTARLRALVRDDDDNVREVAINTLSRLTGHADDALYLEALTSDGAQAVRAAAIALKGSAYPGVRAAANREFERWVTRGNASARDTRTALLAAAGRPATDDRPPAIHVELPADAVALALGADRRLVVTLAPSSGGGSFTVRLRGDVAPIMAARVLWLARGRYYDNLTWHRVEHDFVIQGGSPDANEYVGFPQFMRDELGTVPHTRGTVGMSTRGHDTGDAQWFVNLRDNLRLGADYTVFAEVTSGMDVVDGVLEGDTIASIREVRNDGR
jgi:cyclophilin family peptidyl-prolyl cis-trans isomerase